MARIRSVHPGLFTDEAFVTLSAQAQILLIGIWTECDDQGMFDWKPLTLKMRLLPAVNVDVATLLDELLAADVTRRIEVSGRSYGLVRNFRKYQRPKKPHDVHPLPPECRTYVGLGVASSEPVPHQTPSGTEIPPQMEDGGKGEGVVKVKEEVEAPLRVAPASKPAAVEIDLTLPSNLDRRNQRGTRLPAEWLPSNEDVRFAIDELADMGRVDQETHKFRDHWSAKAGKDATKVNWSATWRNWVRRANEYGSKSGKATATGNGFATLAAARIFGEGSA